MFMILFLASHEFLPKQKISLRFVEGITLQINKHMLKGWRHFSGQIVYDNHYKIMQGIRKENELYLQQQTGHISYTFSFLLVDFVANLLQMKVYDY